MPDRGWGYQAVRVCKPCYSATVDGVLDVSGPNTEPNEVQVRKVGETVVGTVTSLATALEFPINVIKDSARYTFNTLWINTLSTSFVRRPDYWVPDSEISQCSVCDKDIGGSSMTSSQTSQNSATAAECRRVHHCRQCGQGDQLTTLHTLYLPLYLLRCVQLLQRHAETRAPPRLGHAGARV